MPVAQVTIFLQFHGMQGKKNYQEKLLNDFRLSGRVPEQNFYRRLKSVLDLNYLYARTKDFYGDSD
ncbi:MAG: hypothetical protein CL526_07600 [Aequorivita sp.]|nr:hypothetical protein [Aequorivita sp.]